MVDRKVTENGSRISDGYGFQIYIMFISYELCLLGLGDTRRSLSYIRRRTRDTDQFVRRAASYQVPDHWTERNW